MPLDESNESGRREIYMRPFPDVGGGRWQVSTGGGRMPLWSRNGQELFYLSPNDTLMSVRVEPGPSWRSGSAVRVLQGRCFSSNVNVTGGRAYDVARDSHRRPESE